MARHSIHTPEILHFLLIRIHSNAGNSIFSKIRNGTTRLRLVLPLEFRIFWLVFHSRRGYTKEKCCLQYLFIRCILTFKANPGFVFFPMKMTFHSHQNKVSLWYELLHARHCFEPQRNLSQGIKCLIPLHFKIFWAGPTHLQPKAEVTSGWGFSRQTLGGLQMITWFRCLLSFQIVHATSLPQVIFFYKLALEKYKHVLNMNFHCRPSNKKKKPRKR